MVRTYRSAKDLRTAFGINPITKEVERRFHPFYISLPLMTSQLIGFSERKGIFTYGKNQLEANGRACLFWNHFYRVARGLRDHEYPKLVQLDPKNFETATIAYKIDDDDFDNFWKAAKTMPHYYSGEIESPVTFCVANDVDIFDRA